MEQTVTSDAQAAYITEIGRRNYMVDEVEGRIQFLDSRFYKAGPELYVPSVTTILEAYPKGAAFAEWLKRNGEDADEIRDEAGRRGSVVHHMTETLDMGGTLELMTPDGLPQYKLNEWAMMERYVEFRKRFPMWMHAIELNMVSADLGYAGTLDRVVTLKEDGATYLMDIKTSGAIHDAYWMQQAAYLNLLIHTGHIAKLFPDGNVPEIHLAILWLNAKTRTDGSGKAIQGTGWQFIRQPEPTADLLDMFNCVHAVWTKANKTMKPRLTSYKLSHQLSTTPKNHV